MSFYQNYIYQCNKRGVSPSKAAVDAGTTKTSVNRWKNGSLPTDATIAKLANYFNCAVTDLIGENNPAPTDGNGIDEKTKQVISMFESLSEQQKDWFLAQLQGIAQHQSILDDPSAKK